MSDALEPIPGVFRTFPANGIALRARVVGEGPPVVMVHGFPESWYSWRHQLGPIADAGFTAVAIDVRGYGGSDKPYTIEAYDMAAMTGDVASLIDSLGLGPAILVGHDWGAPIVWHTALVHTDRVRGVAGLSVPYTGVPDRPLLEVYEERFTARNRFFYQVYFQDVGGAEAALEADPGATLRKFYYALCGQAPEGAWPNDKPHGAGLLDGLKDPDPFPDWLSPQDIAYYTGEFAASGFRGPLNRYRTSSLDFAFLDAYRKRTIDQPSLYIAGRRDLVLPLYPSNLEALMRPVLTDLRGIHMLDGVGHWTQQEDPSGVNAVLIPWLKDVAGKR